MFFEKGARNILDRDLDPFGLLEAAHKIEVCEIKCGITSVRFKIPAIREDRILVNFNKGNVGDWRRRRALVSAFAVAAEGPTHALCLGAGGIEFLFDLRIIVSRVLPLVRWLLVTMYGNKRLPFDYQLDEFFAAGCAPEFLIVAAHNSTIS